MPLMTLALKRGFGRLIRRSDDSGVVAILDERLSSKRLRPPRLPPRSAAGLLHARLQVGPSLLPQRD